MEEKILKMPFLEFYYFKYALETKTSSESEIFYTDNKQMSYNVNGNIFSLHEIFLFSNKIHKLLSDETFSEIVTSCGKNEPVENSERIVKLVNLGMISPKCITIDKNVKLEVNVHTIDFLIDEELIEPKDLIEYNLSEKQMESVAHKFKLKGRLYKKMHGYLSKEYNENKNYHLFKSVLFKTYKIPEEIIEQYECKVCSSLTKNQSTKLPLVKKLKIKVNEIETHDQWLNCGIKSHIFKYLQKQNLENVLVLSEKIKTESFFNRDKFLRILANGILNNIEFDKACCFLKNMFDCFGIKELRSLQKNVITFIKRNKLSNHEIKEIQWFYQQFINIKDVVIKQNNCLLLSQIDIMCKNNKIEVTYGNLKQKND